MVADGSKRFSFKPETYSRTIVKPIPQKSHDFAWDILDWQLQNRHGKSSNLSDP